MTKSVSSSNNDFRFALSDSSHLSQIGQTKDNKTVKQNTSLNALTKSIMKKLDTSLSFGNFFNGLHNRIANKLNHQREIKLNETWDNIEKSYNKDSKTFEAVGLKETKIITNLPNSVQKLYKQALGLQKSSNPTSVDDSNGGIERQTTVEEFSNLPQMESLGSQESVSKIAPKQLEKIELTNEEFQNLWANKDPEPLGRGAFGTVYGSKKMKMEKNMLLRFIMVQVRRI